MPTYIRPQTLDEAFASLSQSEDAKFFAGGTDILVLLRENVIAPSTLIDVKALPEFCSIKAADGKLEIGAAVTCNEIIASSAVSQSTTLLKQAAENLANSLLRNRATLVGNLCNASPGADMATAALVLQGVLSTASPSGGREIPLKDFFVGVKKHVLAPDEVVTKISFPITEGKGFYLKKRRIRGHDLAQVGVSGFHDADGSFRLALGAVAITPILLDDFGTMSSEELLAAKDSIVAKAVEAAKPISDVRSSKEYRLAMVGHFTERIVDALARGTEVER